MNNIFELIDAEQFAAKIEQASGDVVVKVTTPWSGGCHIIAPMLEAVAHQYPKRLKFYVLRCETRSPLVARYGLNVFPTVLLFRAGDLIDR
ncbi:MAG: thioredoxin family protein, partial [Bacteroidia bacterium]|nr:thioredoxin family protein [Bacteroidia bacterium]